MNELESLSTFLIDLEAHSQDPTKPPKNRMYSDQNIITNMIELLKSISNNEYKANKYLRSIARSLIRDISIIESYIEDKYRYIKCIK